MCFIACPSETATVAEADAPDTSVLVDVSVDALSDTSGDSDLGDTEVQASATPPLTLAERGFVETRTIVHLHSAFSHDACDDEGLDEFGAPNLACVNRMKAALCQERIGMAFMTDHPSHMREQPFSSLLYVDESAGDSYLLDESTGEPWAASFACPVGQGGPDGRVWFQVGLEATHTMPIGLRRHAANTDWYSQSITTDVADSVIAETTAAVRALGGMVAIAHSEEEDIEAAQIAGNDITAMEVYNFHANFNTIMDGDLIGALFQLDPFLGAGGPDADLVGLVLMVSYPEPAYDKWKEVLKTRSITPIGGADAHENVLVPALCAQLECETIQEEAPNLAAFLKIGGPLPLNDGERIDAYERVFRWVQNHLWVAPNAEPVEGPVEAMEAGRTSVNFEILGRIDGASFIAQSATAGTLVDMGGLAQTGDGPWNLWIRTPKPPQPLHTSSWTDGSPALLRAILHRTTATGTEVVAELDAFEQWHRIENAAPGAYHVELRLTPTHLVGALPGMEAFATSEFRWSVTGAIRIQ